MALQLRGLGVNLARKLIHEFEQSVPLLHNTAKSKSAVGFCVADPDQKLRISIHSRRGHGCNLPSAPHQHVKDSIGSSECRLERELAIAHAVDLTPQKEIIRLHTISTHALRFQRNIAGPKLRLESLTARPELCAAGREQLLVPFDFRPQGSDLRPNSTRLGDLVPERLHLQNRRAAQQRLRRKSARMAAKRTSLLVACQLREAHGVEVMATFQPENSPSGQRTAADGAVIIDRSATHGWQQRRVCPANSGFHCNRRCIESKHRGLTTSGQRGPQTDQSFWPLGGRR